MKFSTIILLIVALLASIAFSAPAENKKEYEDEFYKYCQNIEFKKPVDGVMYMINSTQVADFVIPKDCMEKYGSYLMTTVEIFSIGGNKVIDTIIEQEYNYNHPNVFLYLIDKVWANKDAKYLLIASLHYNYYHVQSKSGMFIVKDKKY